MNASEPPILDGSARPFVNLIIEGEPVEQDKEREYFVLDAPVSVTRGQLVDHRAPARRPEDLVHVGGRPRDPHAAPVAARSTRRPTSRSSRRRARSPSTRTSRSSSSLGRSGAARSTAPSSSRATRSCPRSPCASRTSSCATRSWTSSGTSRSSACPSRRTSSRRGPGHAINAELTKALFERLQERKQGRRERRRERRGRPIKDDVESLDIRSILDVLPHRYPFVMIDRVVEFKGDRASWSRSRTSRSTSPTSTATSRATPSCPGVLQLEAMAQAAGILIIRHNNWDAEARILHERGQGQVPQARASRETSSASTRSSPRSAAARSPSPR